MATNPYSYGSLGARWTVGEPTSKSLLDISRVKNDANRWVLEQLLTDPDDSTTGFGLLNGVTATTQSPSDNSTKVATTAYADAAASASATPPGGANTEIQYNNSGVFGASSNLTFDGSTLNVVGNAGIGIARTEGTLHVHTASAGVVTAPTTADDLVVEHSVEGGISILGGVTVDSHIVMGASNDNAGFDMQYNHTTGAMTWSIAGSDDALTATGSRWGIRETTNANQAIGLTINQLTQDNEILAFKSSDVAHAMTSVAEADTYGFIRKAGANTGGLVIYGLTEGTSSGVQIQARSTGDFTTKSAATGGNFSIYAAKSDGSTGVTSNGTNANLVVVGDGSTGSIKFLIDQEGDVHYDATTNANAWDDYEDIALLNTVRNLQTGQKAQNIFGEFVSENAQLLHDTGVITLNDDGHHFVSTKGLNALMIDTIRQEGMNWRKAIEARDAEIRELRNEMKLLKGHK